MPLYDVQCTQCGKEFEHFCKIDELNSIYCSCGGKCKTLITNYHNQDWFKPHWNPNFDLEPIFVKSRNHFKELCLKYNMTPSCMGDIRNIKEI